MKLFLEFIVFPGFIFTAVSGMVLSWIDRKVTARVQWRQGPPFFQPFYDFVKLLGKETVIPDKASKAVFIITPFVAIVSTVIVSMILWKSILSPESLFVGDLIVVVYLLAMTPLAVILGAGASGNPIASLAASREMKLFLSYELPFVFSMSVPILQLGTIKLGEMIANQQQAGAVIGSVSGIVAAAVFLISIQAKLGLVPFDMAEAETEIAGGVFIEYSGFLLAMHKLNRIMLLFIIPVFMLVLFLGGINTASAASVFAGILKYLAVFVLIILMRNTNPRIKVDQAVKFFWRTAFVFSIFAVTMALIGY